MRAVSGNTPRPRLLSRGAAAAAAAALRALTAAFYDMICSQISDTAFPDMKCSQKAAINLGSLSMQAQENPFKSGTVADGSFFTGCEELPQVRQMLSDRNHLAVISPRRYGKTSLVRKAVMESGRPVVFVNVQMALSAVGLAELLLKSFLALHPWERFKDALRKFRVKPVFSYSPETNGVEVAFDSSAKGSVALEDVLALMDEKSEENNRLIVVLDEFQEIASLEPGTDKLLRAVMQLQKNINYLFLGSEESMMTAIFEDIKSPFFHFGSLMRLGRIPYEDFCAFLTERLVPVRGEEAKDCAREILEFTGCHPFCTQQLAAVFWDLCVRTGNKGSVQAAADHVLRSLSASYAVLWSRFSRTNRRVLETLARGAKLQEIRELPSSTVYTAAARLKKEGIVIREEDFELEDPFFALWIRRAKEQAAVGLPSFRKAAP